MLCVVFVREWMSFLHMQTALHFATRAVLQRGTKRNEEDERRAVGSQDGRASGVRASSQSVHPTRRIGVYAEKKELGQGFFTMGHPTRTGPQVDVTLSVQFAVCSSMTMAEPSGAHESKSAMCTPGMTKMSQVSILLTSITLASLPG